MFGQEGDFHDNTRTNYLPIKVKIDFRGEGGVVFWRKQLFHGDLFEVDVFYLFRCKYMVNLVEVVFDTVDGCIKINGFKMGVGFSFFKEEQRNLVFVIFNHQCSDKEP